MGCSAGRFSPPAQALCLISEVTIPLTYLLGCHVSYSNVFDTTMFCDVCSLKNGNKVTLSSGE